MLLLDRSGSCRWTRRERSRAGERTSIAEVLGGESGGVIVGEEGKVWWMGDTTGRFDHRVVDVGLRRVLGVCRAWQATVCMIGCCGDACSCVAR